jgi:hypothetical protein
MIFADLGSLAIIAGLATFIVQAAQFAIDWKRKNKTDAPELDIEALKTELETVLGDKKQLSEEQRRKIIEKVAIEVGKKD